MEGALEQHLDDTYVKMYTPQAFIYSLLILGVAY